MSTHSTILAGRPQEPKLQQISADNRNTTLRSGPLTTRLTLDEHGRIIRKTEEAGTQTTTWDYSYDTQGRLWRTMRNGAPAEAYEYDHEGRRILEANRLAGNPNRRFIYGPDDRLLQAGRARFQYDEAGRLIARMDDEGKTTTYGYGQDGRTRSVTLPDGETVRHSYGDDGQRSETHSDGWFICNYEWDGPLRLTSYFNGSFHRFEYGEGRMPESMTVNGTKKYSLGFDHVGTLKAVADEQGHLVKLVEYDSFGNLLFDSNPAIDVPFGFGGGIRDQRTGLVHFPFRDYDPAFARWTSKDPLGHAAGDPDLYGYCLDDPINGFDPLGLFRFGKRTLKDFPHTPDIPWLDKHNWELKHEHGFYEDAKGGNIGQGPSGPMTKENKEEYILSNNRYDDSTMRRAQEAIGDWKWEATTANCQHYADKMRETYRQILRDDTFKKGEEDYRR